MKKPRLLTKLIVFGIFFLITTGANSNEPRNHRAVAETDIITFPSNPQNAAFELRLELQQLQEQFPGNRSFTIITI